MPLGWKTLRMKMVLILVIWGSQKGGFQDGGFGGCCWSPPKRNEGTINKTTTQKTGTTVQRPERWYKKTGTRVHWPKPPFYTTAFLFLPSDVVYCNALHQMNSVWFQCCNGLHHVLGFPWPQTGARIPISWKRGFRGPKTPISPRSGKGSFCQKNPLFSTREHIENGEFWTKNSLFQPLQGRGDRLGGRPPENT